MPRVQLDDQGDELAEEITSPNNLVQPRELGVPIQFVRQPNYEIVDLARGGQRARPEVATANPNQIELVDTSEPGPSRQPEIPTETRDQERGTKHPILDSDKEEKKRPKLRPRRTREQMREEAEKKRKREQHTEESEGPSGRPQPPFPESPSGMAQQPFPGLPSGMAQYLPSDTTGESDAMGVVRTLEVDVELGSDVPTRLLRAQRRMT